ncbi:uncharacterized protein N7479_003823 [Penicillium vulpinum]|uniref:EGF-like domain-containing protein n=1 Tax=Penicillium vulpinum TaxID=29845 RepID=A0A1V6RFH6_9EURO|nr:uncharacterized protein N7479_003823 [Penicillium vulpinum]KAJ5963947.1 hypothetical protein N7479_003823 [Penicillium vulpinum]OQE00537.1 hypothetical protein PENVUL_c050G09312 [Penicillium vulpinum]
MRLSIILLTSLASIATAVPATDAANNNCGWPNGNCYGNDCHGELSGDKITCTSGKYLGCQCGYGCGRKTGKCNENGCDGRNGRCTNNYLGCSCN